MSKKQTSFVLRWLKKKKKKSQLTCHKRLQYLPIFPASLFYKATEEEIRLIEAFSSCRWKNEQAHRV